MSTAVERHLKYKLGHQRSLLTFAMEKVTDEDDAVPRHDDQSKEHPHEGMYLDQRVCVSAFHPDTNALLHDKRLIALQEEPNLHRTSTC